jgi:hypothetical protein
VFTRVFFSAPLSFNLCAHLRFDLSPQSRFVIGALQSFSFCLAPRFLFDATTLSFFSQHPGLLG